MKNVLNNIIQSLSKQEIRFFKLFIKRTDYKKRKDVDLFDLMKRKGGDLKIKDALKKLETNTNNYHQIKNRLYHELNNSMVWQHIWKDNQSKSFSYVLLARVYKNKGELELAFHYLNYAQKEALDSELYEILSIVYTEIIQLSHELISIDVDKYIALKKENILILSAIDEVDMLLSKVMYDMKTKQNFGKADLSLYKIVKSKYIKIAKDKKLVNSARFRMRLFKMYSRLQLQKRDYKSLEKFLIESYNEFEKDNLFSRSNHNEKLTLLTYLTNCLCKNKKHKESIKYAELLLISMKEYDSFLHDKYLFFYYNILVSNYAKTDKDKALDYLNKASNNEVIKQLPSYTSFIYLNKALIYFHEDDFRQAQKNMSRLILQEDFLFLDKAFQLKVLITDIIIRFKNGRHDIIDKIEDIRKNHKQLLLDEEYFRDREMINIISKKMHDEDIADDKKRILSSMSDYDSEDLDIISYNIWLRNNL